ncbi:MAG: serine/threonine-protein kinase, partial [Vicinamibacterales bacterium]
MSALDPSADAIFLALADVDPSERQASLDRRCAGNPKLRADVEALLAAVDVPDEFLDPAHVPSLDLAAIDGPLQPGTHLDEFLVLHAIGSGGMGVVYAALQDRPRRTVAIKVLRHGARRRDLTKRFELEAEVLGRLQHPGIAHVHAFHAGGRGSPAYLVMELIAGPPITEYTQAHDLPYMARVALAAKVCDAVQHAHERGVIHRDLKPANVLVAEDGQPKVLDFGIARASGLDLQLSTIQTLHGQLVGTLAYMSPEQLRARPDEIDARSDVYALGVLIYRVLSGRLPFDIAGEPFAEAMRLVLEAEPIPLGLADSDLRGPLEQIVAKAMARDRRERYQSAAALAADLRAFVDQRPLSLGDPLLGAMRRQVQRYRRVVATSAAAALVLAAFAGFALVERRRGIDATARLEHEVGASRIERGRLLAASGSLSAAEALLWPEYFRRVNKDDPRWALRELYSRQPVLWTAAAHAGAARVARVTADGAFIVTGGADGSLVVWNAATGRGGGPRRAPRGPGRARARRGGGGGGARAAARGGAPRARAPAPPPPHHE